MRTRSFVWEFLVLWSTYCRKYTHVLALQVIGSLVLRVHTLAHDRIDIIPQTKTVELVIVKRCICLRHKSVEEIGSALQVNKNFQRYDALAGFVDRRRRECLQTSYGCEVPGNTFSLSLM